MLDEFFFDDRVGCAFWRLQNEIMNFCSDFGRQGGNYIIKASLLGCDAPCSKMGFYLRKPNLWIGWPNYDGGSLTETALATGRLWPLKLPLPVTSSTGSSSVIESASRQGHQCRYFFFFFFFFFCI